ncbi:MAG: hypothetical protein ACREX0_15915, partial [Noviherbaspirillum sp.]
MNAHIPKPIDPDVLFETLARWSGRQAAARGSAAAPVLPPIEGIDTASALRRVGGNTTLYLK